MRIIKINLRVALWALLLAIGCSSGPKVDPYDLEGPIMDFTSEGSVGQGGSRAGTWISTFGGIWIFEQDGDHAVVRLGLKSKSGVVKGRVFLADDQTLIVTAAPDRESATYEGNNFPKGQLHKLVAGPSSEHPLTAKDPLLSGGMICNLPVATDGRFMALEGRGSSSRGKTPHKATPHRLAPPLPDYPSQQSTTESKKPAAAAPPGTPRPPKTPTFQIRPCLVTSGYARDKEGRIQERWTVIPLEAPNIAVETDAEGLRPIGKTAFYRSRLHSPLYKKQPGSLDGKPCSWIAVPKWTPETAGIDPDTLGVECYVDSGSPPIDVLMVARRDERRNWISMPDYLHLPDKATRVQVNLGGDLFARVEAIEDKEPLIEPFIVARETSVFMARWRTDMLLLAKNRTLPKMLREGTTSSLTDLVTHVEKTILALGHEREMTNNSVQQAIESGGHAEDLTELSLVYKERMEVLKPILAAIKEEVANRSK